MSDYTTVNYRDVDDRNGMHFLRDELGCEQMGVTVEDEEIEMQDGDAIRIPPEATHQIHNGDVESRFVLMGAP